MKSEIVEPSEADAVDETAPTSEAAPRPTPVDNPEGMLVRYIGTSNFRHVLREEWARIGIDHETLSWERSGPRQVVPCTEIHLNPLDFERYILSDPDLRLEPVEVR